MLRKILWKFVADKIKIITCPTQDLKISLDQLKYLIKRNYFTYQILLLVLRT